LPALKHFQGGRQWPGLQTQSTDLVETALEGEFLLTPGPTQDVNKLCGAGVARIVFEQLCAIHAKLMLVPARGHVDRPPPAGQPIERRTPLSNRSWQEKSRMDGRNQLDACGMSGIERRHGQAIV
jgi:hypothetical protein